MSEAVAFAPVSQTRLESELKAWLTWQATPSIIMEIKSPLSPNPLIWSV